MLTLSRDGFIASSHIQGFRLLVHTVCSPCLSSSYRRLQTKYFLRATL